MVETVETGTIRVRENAEPQHDGRTAVVDDEEVRPHPAADWAQFQRACCAGCPRC